MNGDQKSFVVKNVTLQNGYGNGTEVKLRNAVDEAKKSDKKSPSPSPPSSEITTKHDVAPSEKDLNSSARGSNDVKPLPVSVYLSDSMIRSCSVGYLDMVDAQLVPNEVTLSMLRKETPKRLVLVNRRTKHRRTNRRQMNMKDVPCATSSKSPKLRNCRKSRSLDSSELIIPSEFSATPKEESIPEVAPETKTKSKSSATSPTTNACDVPNPGNGAGSRKENKLGFFGSMSPLMKRRKPEQCDSVGKSPEILKNRNRGKQKSVPKMGENVCGNVNGVKQNVSLHTHALVTLENLLLRLREDSTKREMPPPSPRLPKSSPASPAPAKKGKKSYNSLSGLSSNTSSHFKISNVKTIKSNQSYGIPM